MYCYCLLSFEGFMLALTASQDYAELTEIRFSSTSIIKQLTSELFQHGFSGFVYQGIARRAYRDYCYNNDTVLFKPQHLLSPNSYIASDDRINLLYRQYISRYAAKDANFVELLRLKKAFSYRLHDKAELTKLGSFFQFHDIAHVLSIPMTDTNNNSWSGGFLLFSKYSQQELSIDLEKVLSSLERSYVQLHEWDRQRFNPYRHSQVFKKTSVKILKLVAEGLSSYAIAKEVHLTERGVEYHLEKMRLRLNANNRANLIHKAHQLELI